MNNRYGEREESEVWTKRVLVQHRALDHFSRARVAEREGKGRVAPTIINETYNPTTSQQSQIRLVSTEPVHSG